MQIYLQPALEHLILLSVLGLLLLQFSSSAPKASTEKLIYAIRGFSLAYGLVWTGQVLVLLIWKAPLFEYYALVHQLFGKYAFLFWPRVIFFVLLPQLLWIGALYRSKRKLQWFTGIYLLVGISGYIGTPWYFFYRLASIHFHLSSWTLLLPFLLLFFLAYLLYQKQWKRRTKRKNQG
ncbi:MAG: hypothetical protein AAFR61_31945 [Bacteroidota bacterium]